MAQNRVVELRVHGVGGPTPGDVLETVDPVPIDGADGELAGFYKRDKKGQSGQDVEAFVWGGLTSRTAIQAAWWLLLPFALINVAGWMIRSGRSQTERSGTTVAWWIRFFMTIAGLFITALYLLWSAVALIDVVAYQCGGQAECVNRSWLLPLRWLTAHPMWRIAVGGFVLMAILLGLLYAARLSHKRYEEFEPDDTRRDMAAKRPRSLWTRNDSLKHPAYWYNWKEWRRLFYGHAYVGLAVVTAIVGYSMAVADNIEPFSDATSWTPALVWSIVLGVVTLGILILLLRPPTFNDTGPMPQHAGKWFVVAIAVVAIASVSFFSGWGYYRWVGDPTPLEGGLGLPTAIAWFFVAQVMLLIPGLILVVINFRSHFRWRRFFGLTPPINDGFRLVPPVVAVVAGFAIANAGFGAVIVRLADFLDGTGESVTFGSAEGGFLGSAGLAVDIFLVGALVGAILMAAPMVKGLATKAYSSGVARDYDSTAASGKKDRFIKKVSAARVTSQIGRNVDRFLTGLTVGVVAASAVVFARLILRHSFADIVQPLVGFGSDTENWTESIRNTTSVALLLYVFPGALVVRAGARNRGTRRQVGKVWDSITFFPRRFHPLGPPCYAERAVPMLREYLRDRAVAGDQVVIRAHSQGTVLSFAALSQLLGESSQPTEWMVESPAPETAPAPIQDDQGTLEETYESMAKDAGTYGATITDGIALVTLGSPLGTLHGPFFPGYFSKNLYDDVSGALSGRWKNFYRETDYIGKALFVDPDRELDIHGYIVPDEQTPDGDATKPAPPDYSINDPVDLFGVMQRHSGYHKATEVKQAIHDYATSFGAVPPPETAEGDDVTVDLRRITEDPEFIRSIADLVSHREGD